MGFARPYKHNDNRKGAPRPSELPPMRNWFVRKYLMLRWRVRCWLSLCPGKVVTGVHSGEVWAGWRCSECLRVKHYAPTGRRVDERA